MRGNIILYIPTTDIANTTIRFGGLCIAKGEDLIVFCAFIRQRNRLSVKQAITKQLEYKQYFVSHFLCVLCNTHGYSVLSWG